MTQKILAIGSEKGGVGKTTTAVTLVHALALQNFKVLLIDMDSQGNCAIALGVTAEKTTYLDHVRLDTPLTIKIDGKKSQAVILPNRR